jgi:hypothetical protein
MRTHQVSIADGVVTKRYESWARGEPQRERAALTRAYRHTHDLVPQPLTADFDSIPPTIMMSVVAGTPLRDALSSVQLDALERALRELWSVPAADLIPRRSPAEDLRPGYGRLVGCPRPAGGIAREVYDAALAWWAGPDLDQFREPYAEPVLGHADPNLANYLWDGTRIRIVDFEDAGRSDLATELATLVEHLGARATNWDVFLGNFDVDPARLLAARRTWAVFWLQLLLPGGPAARRNPPETLPAHCEHVLNLLT